MLWIVVAARERRTAQRSRPQVLFVDAADEETALQKIRRCPVFRAVTTALQAFPLAKEFQAFEESSL